MEEEVEYITDDEVVMSEQEESNHEYAQSTQHLEDEDDVDEWLNAQIKKHMSMQKLKSKKDALISIIKSIRQEMRDGIKKRPFLESTRAQVNVFNEEILFEIGREKVKFNMNSHQSIEKIYMGEIAGPVGLSPDRRGLVKRWHVCKPIHVTYNDGSGEDCGMWPTYDHDSKFCFRYNEVFRVNEHGILRKLMIQLVNKGKKWYVLDDVWEKCEQCYKKTNEAWHNKGYEEDEIWQSRDEKTDYDPPYVNIKNFEVKRWTLWVCSLEAPTRLNSSTWATKWFQRLVAYAKCNRDSYENELGDKELARRRR
ncbi:hypothetical protein Tco_1216246 [Tanacetum coccineum]